MTRSTYFENEIPETRVISRSVALYAMRFYIVAGHVLAIDAVAAEVEHYPKLPPSKIYVIGHPDIVELRVNAVKLI